MNAADRQFAEIFARSSLFRAILRDQHKDVIKQIIKDDPDLVKEICTYAYANDQDFKEAMGG